MLSNLPPGCSESDIPGCTRMDMAIDKAIDKKQCIACLWHEKESEDKLKKMYEQLVSGRDCHACKHRRKPGWETGVNKSEACKQCKKLDFSGFETDTLESFKESRETTRGLNCSNCKNNSRFIEADLDKIQERMLEEQKQAEERYCDE